VGIFIVEERNGKLRGSAKLTGERTGEYQTPNMKDPQKFVLVPVRGRKTGNIVRYIVRKSE